MTAPHTQCQPDIDDAAPRPWRSISGDSQICDKNGMFVADVAQGISGTCWPTSRANARLIVDAVNTSATLQAKARASQALYENAVKKHIECDAELGKEIAALKSRGEELTKALEPILGVIEREWQFNGAHPHREAMIERARRALAMSLEQRDSK